MRTTVAWVLSLFVALAACAADHGRIHAPPVAGEGNAEHDETSHGGGAVRVVRYDVPFSLAYGQRVRVEGGNTRARFAALVEDSRCPTGVQCIQAGRARVRLEVARGSRAPSAIELGTDSGASLASAGGVTWELQDVSPYPAAGHERRTRDYVLTLVAHPQRNR
ncbi:MAG TPA: hypothetical protein VN811_14180 [Thermoanaerobaculia bacterium]|nr:hypothetical protein [Thermoanaerobaculia bacterium]